MSTVVKNEEELNTLIAEDLVTEHYALEILGLKNVSDFRKFSRSFMKLTEITKGIENNIDDKLDKGNIPKDWDSAEKIKGKVEDKVSKSGDTMTGKLIVKDAIDCVDGYTMSLDISSGGWARSLGMIINGNRVGSFGFYGNGENINCIFIGKDYNNPNMKLYTDGNLELKANNLGTQSKEVVDAINESLWTTRCKQIPKVIDLNTLTVNGLYFRDSANLDGLTNYPKDLRSGNFVLRVMTSDPNQVTTPDWQTQILYVPQTAQMFVRYVGYLSSGWSDWQGILTNESSYYLGLLGTGEYPYIQDVVNVGEGQLYIDKVTKKPYIATSTNSDGYVSDNFLEVTIQNLSNEIRIRGMYFCLAYDRASSYGVELIHKPDHAGDVLKIRILIAGVYTVNATQWCDTSESYDLRQNGNIISHIPAFSGSLPSNVGGLNYTGHFNAGDIVSINYTSRGSYDSRDNSFSIIKIR